MINDATLPSCGCWRKTRYLSNRNPCSKGGWGQNSVHPNIWKFRKEFCITLFIQIHDNKNQNEKYFLILIFVQKKQTLQELDISLTNCLYNLNKCICMHTLANSIQSNDLHRQLWVFFQVSRSFNSAQLLHRPLKIWPMCFIYKHIKWTSRLI